VAVPIDPLAVFGLLGDEDLEPEGGTPQLRRAPFAAKSDLPAEGVLIGERFRIRGRLGKGAFGDVLLAHDETLTRSVAIKLLRRQEPEARARFLREAQAAARLRHPNVLSVFEVGEHKEALYIVYQLVEEACDLRQAFAKRDLAGRLDLFEQVLAGVAAAHAEGIVHRDLKPANVLVEEGRVYVADFGLAHVDGSSLTKTGQFLGTPAYMAPEQVLGKAMTPATDVWALGLILYEAIYETSWLAGQPTLMELISRICQAEFSPPAGAPPLLAELLFERVLLRESDDRIPHAGAFLDSLRRARQRGAPTVRLPRSASFAASLVLAALSGVVATLVVWERTKTPAPAPAPAPAASDPSPPPPAATAAALRPYGTRAFFALRRQLKTASNEGLRAEAERGQIAAMRILGGRLYAGWVLERDVSQARVWWEKAAQLGCPDSMLDLGLSYTEQGSERQLAEGWAARARAAGSTGAHLSWRVGNLGLEPPFRLVRRALARGDDESAVRMAYFYSGRGARGQTLDWLAAAIALGSPEALALRARLELTRAQPDLESAIAGLRAGMSVGDATGILGYARCLIDGRGVAQDLSEARRLLDRAASTATNPGDLAFYRVLLLVFEGKRAAQGRVELGPEIRLCSTQGSRYAKAELGLVLLQLSRRKGSDPKLRVMAGRLLQGAKGSVNPKVHVELGLALTRGEFKSARSTQEAAAAFKRAAEQGSPRGYYNWGVALVKGAGVTQDVERGLKWLKRSGEAGLPKGWYSLGFIHANRLSYPRHYDLERALRYFERVRLAGRYERIVSAALELKTAGLHLEARRLLALVAKDGHSAGAWHLAQYLLSGEGGTQDEARAVALLEGVPREDQSARMCQVLADCYAIGRGVLRDLKAAAEWRTRAKALAAPEAGE
jgi:TPR repeat protein